MCLDRQDFGVRLDDGDKLLGDLLGFLRTKKLMSTLMLCRQIEKIELTKGQALFYSENADLSELVSNEKYKQDLDLFFKGKGLSYKIKEIKKEINPIDSLKEMFGDKLIIE